MSWCSGFNLKGGQILLNYDNQVFVCSSREVYCLVQLPFQKQVTFLYCKDQKLKVSLCLGCNSEKWSCVCTIKFSSFKFNYMYWLIFNSWSMLKIWSSFLVNATFPAYIWTALNRQRKSIFKLSDRYSMAVSRPRWQFWYRGLSVVRNFERDPWKVLDLHFVSSSNSSFVNLVFIRCRCC